MPYQHSLVCQLELCGVLFKRSHQMTKRAVMVEHTVVGCAVKRTITTRRLVPKDFVRIVIVMMLTAQNMIMALHVIAASNQAHFFVTTSLHFLRKTSYVSLHFSFL